MVDMKKGVMASKSKKNKVISSVFIVLISIILVLVLIMVLSISDLNTKNEKILKKDISLSPINENYNSLGNNFNFATSKQSITLNNKEYNFISLTNASISNSNNNLQNYQGYIITFKEKSLIEKKLEIEDLMKSGAKSLGDLKSGLDQQKIVIENEQSQALNDIQTRIFGASKSSSIGEKVKAKYQKVINGIMLNVSDSEANEIKKSPYVKAIYPNYEVHTTLMDSVPLINADDVWQMTDSQGQAITGKDITIAIVDTGVDYTHPDLGGCFGINCKVIGGYDFINNDEDPMDDHGHGTHCAGIAAGNGALKGVAPDAKIYAYKVLNFDGDGWDYQIILGI